MLRKSFLILSLGVLVSGCSSTGNVLSSIAEELMKPECQRHAERLAKYLEAQPNTPPNIVAAMRDARIVKGMTTQQAEVSWGSSDTARMDKYGHHWMWKHTEPRGHQITFNRGIVVSASTYISPFSNAYWRECASSVR